jgi:hypothetical protein
MIPGLLALGSAIGGKAIDKALGLGGGDGGAAGVAAPAAPPVNNAANFGPVSFGARYIGDAAVKEAPAIIAAEDRTWTKAVPWIVGGVVALFAFVAVLGSRKR